MSIPLVIAGVSAAASLLGSAEADSVSRQQHAVSTEMSRRQRLAAKDSALVQFSQLGRRQAEEAASATAEIDYIMRDATEAEGTVRASAGASGVSGQVVDDLVGDYRRQAAEYASNVLRSEEARRRALGDDMNAVSANLRAQYINTTVPPRRRMNYLTAGLGAVSAGVGGYLQAGGTFATPDDGLAAAAAPSTPAPDAPMPWQEAFQIPDYR